MVAVTVENNLVPFRSVTVRLVSATGIRSRLGEVRPRRTSTLRFDGMVSAGNYALIAETSTGGQIISRGFGLFPGANVAWDLRNNTVVVSGS